MTVPINRFVVNVLHNNPATPRRMPTMNVMFSESCRTSFTSDANRNIPGRCVVWAKLMGKLIRKDSMKLIAARRMNHGSPADLSA